MYNYVALFSGVRVDGKNIVPMDRLEYAFHTFSLRNECAYEPTGDVTFASINPDEKSLEGGVERMVNAVLLIDVEAVVLKAEQLKELLDTSVDDTITVGRGMTRTRNELKALYELSLVEHEHSH